MWPFGNETGAPLCQLSSISEGEFFMSGDEDLTSAGMPWNEVPEFARRQVVWMGGRHGSARTPLPNTDVLPVPEVLNTLPYLHDQRPRGTKAMIDAAGARARLRGTRPGTWLISPITGWKWAKWPSGDVGWLPADIDLPKSLQVPSLDDIH
jgi:hypothetical protein